VEAIMSKDDEAARKARAEQLHGEIDKHKKDKQPDAPADATPKQETPAQFVHRRMRELDREKK
jgi:hypothetical protein